MTQREWQFGDVPTVQLYTGLYMPSVGLAAKALDDLSPTDARAAFATALVAGVHHFSCMQGDRHLDVLREVLRSVPRAGVFLSGGIRNDGRGYIGALEGCEDLMKALGIDYFDLLRIDWPFPWGGGAYDHALYRDAWCALQDLHERGHALHLATGNTTVPKLEYLLRDVDTSPAANWMEAHPSLPQTYLCDACQSNEIQPVAYLPLGDGDAAHPVVLEIAKARGTSPEETIYAWAAARGCAIVMRDTTMKAVASATKAMRAPLSEEEVARMESVAADKRIVRGEAFLWKEGQNWRDLWDESGRIAK